MKRVLMIVLTAILMLIMPFSVYGNTQAYILDEETFERIPIPLTYEVVGVIKNLGDEGFLNHAEDIHIDNDNYIYVADTENNRVVKMDSSGEVMCIFDQYEGKNFSKPRGVYVDDEGIVWISDTGNQRVVTFYGDASQRKDYVKPNTTLLGENFSFEPTRLWVSDAGYIYLLRGTSLFSIDENNNFKGFIGAKEVGFDLTRTLIRMFGTQSQKDRTLRQTQDSYSSFVIGSDGMIYGSLSNAEEDQLRRLNSVGKNTFPEGFYSEYDYTEEKGSVSPNITDIHISDYGILTILDKNTGKIYQYDQEGAMLMAFGGLGSFKGTFSIATALDFDNEGNLYVLDYNANTIQIFKPTEFLKNIHEAVNLHSEGRYDEAKEHWNNVLSIHSAYSLAHKGIAKVNYKEKNWEESMARYEMANDKEGYSKAFSQYRHQIFRDNFFLVVLAVVVILVLFVKGFTWLKRKADRLANNIVMGRGANFK